MPLKNEIRILLLEDDGNDAELVRRALRRAGLPFTWRHVDNQTAFLDELERFAPDVILSDFYLPLFDGYAALALAQEKCPNTPFIFVTGALGEEVAVETIKRGAADCVLKQRLTRLAPAVRRALLEAADRAERKRAEESFRLSHQRLRALSMRLLDLGEAERIRVAREVHEELGQTLTGSKLQLVWLSGRLPKNPRELQEKARLIADGIDRTIHAVRRIATELRPGVLDDAGLFAALEWQALEFEKETGIRCRVKSSLRETILNQDLNTTFFRIFQETLTNITRRSGPTRVDVRLYEEPGHLVLEVRDNGCGISAKEIENSKSLGLLGMRERAALLGGQVGVHGASGKGTIVQVRIPRVPANSEREPSHSHEDSAYR